MTGEPQYRAVLAIDVQKSAGRGNMASAVVRDTLYRALLDSFERSGIAWNKCPYDDLGDGARIIMPQTVTKAMLIHPLLHELAEQLRHHNRTADPGLRIRVRAALHAGDTFVDPDGGASGRPLEVLARLLDARPLRRALEIAPGAVPLALLTSQHFYDETVPHGYPGIDAEMFQRVSVAEKEYVTDAWLYVPGFLLDPDRLYGAADQDQVKTVDEKSQTGTQTNTALGGGQIFAVHTGNQQMGSPHPPGSSAAIHRI